MSQLGQPLNWSIREVEEWSRQILLSDETRLSLINNEVDGSTLLTLDKNELRTELGLRSLAARRYLWDAIERLRSQQSTIDLAAAVDIHKDEIKHLESAPTQEGENNVDNAVIQCLRSDAELQRQIVQDNMMAHKLQGGYVGQQFYEDSQFAQEEQARIERLSIQAEFDYEYARSLDDTRRTRDKPARGVKSLFSLCIKKCVENKINVADELESGHVRVLAPSVNTNSDSFLKLAREDEELANEEVEDRKVPAIPFMTLKRCDSCYDEEVRGVNFACNHTQCLACLTSLFQTALKDNSLLPLRCCEVPIDMNISRILLRKAETEILHQRVTEIEATNKMYCPSCSAFINLDLVDSSTSIDMICQCGEGLCITCLTASHPGFTCSENKGRLNKVDETFFELSKGEGWKQCPSCCAMVELRSGCNHITCACKFEFCFQCLRPWDNNNGVCSSGRCEVWQEENLIEGGEARVQAEEAARGEAYRPEERRLRLGRAMQGLRANEGCTHIWRRRNGYLGNCERCGYDLWVYGYVCSEDCQSTVCYTCANHRIPQRGWR